MPPHPTSVSPAGERNEIDVDDYHTVFRSTDDEDNMEAKKLNMSYTGEDMTGSMTEASEYDSPMSPVLGSNPPKKLEEVAEEGEEEEAYEVEFPDDVYSMMFVSSVTSPAFWYSVFVFCFQMTILWLAFVDLIEDEPGQKDQNRFNAANTVPIQVNIAQGIALFIALMNQDDVTLTLLIVSIGMGPKFSPFQRSLQQRYPGGANAWQFWMANFLRFCEGIVVILVSFIFIVQAEDVLGIFLDFAAIEFVSELDNLAYRLGTEGWLGHDIRQLTNEIGEEKLPAKKEKKGLIDYVNRVILFALLALLFTGCGVVFHRQENTGYYIQIDTCSVLDVKFGDEVYTLPKDVSFKVTEGINGTKKNLNSKRFIPSDFNFEDPPDLHFAYFSGTYRANFDEDAGIDNVRPVYYEESKDVGVNDSTLGMFYYCEKENAWVWSVRAFVDAGAVPPETVGDQRCKYGWLLKSPKTQAVTLDEVPADGWKIWTGVLSSAPGLSFTCLECESHLDCGLNRGTCKDGTCKCNEGAGSFCNEDVPCTTIFYVENDDENGTNVQFESGYVVENGLMSHGRLIYVGSWTDKEGVKVEIILHTGRRWFDTLWDEKQLDEFISANSSDIHAYWYNLLLEKVKWYSQVTESFLPTGPLKWYQIHDTQSVGSYGPFGRTIPSAFQYECLSVNCNASSLICGKNGTCESNRLVAFSYIGTELVTIGGKCKCDEGFHGHFCEYKNETGSWE